MFVLPWKIYLQASRIYKDVPAGLAKYGVHKNLFGYIYIKLNSYMLMRNKMKFALHSTPIHVDYDRYKQGQAYIDSKVLCIQLNIPITYAKTISTYNVHMYGYY